MDDLSIYEIMYRLNRCKLEEQIGFIRNSCIDINFQRNDNMFSILNRCYKEIRNHVIKYITEELEREGFKVSKIKSGGEAYKVLSAKKNDIKIEIEYRILANNLTSLKYSIKKGRKKKEKRFSSMEALLNTVREMTNNAHESGNSSSD